MGRIQWYDIEAMGGIGALTVPYSAPTPGAAERRQRRLHRSWPARLGQLALWRYRMQQRASLAQLDARMLRDIGITRLDAQRECQKPFWR